MKINNGFELNEVCGVSFLVPMGMESVDFTKLISLNESSLLLWNTMKAKGDFTERDLTEALLNEYEVDEATAAKDVRTLVERMKEEGIIED